MFDFSKANYYISRINEGITEEQLIQDENITYEELYAVISFENQQFAYDHLNHFCRGCFFDLCFFWPNVDEKSCPVRGYEPNCPLYKNK